MMTKSSIDKSRSRYGEYVNLRFHKPTKLYQLSWATQHKPSDKSYLIANFTETDGEYAIKLWETLETLLFENNTLKCALALEDITSITSHNKKIDIPPYYEFEDKSRYYLKKERREYDPYD